MNEAAGELGIPGDTLESEPEIASAIFGERVGLARTFARAFAEHGEERGLIGPGELGRLWSRHLINCGLLAPLLRPGKVGDVGSGAGLPGIVLAIARADVDFVLIEPMERRVAWLQEQQTALGLNNVEVVRGRAESVQLSDRLDQVTARAVTALRRLLPWTAPLLRDGGELLLMKGAGAAAEIASAQKELRRQEVHHLEVLELGADLPGGLTRVIRATVR